MQGAAPRISQAASQLIPPRQLTWRCAPLGIRSSSQLPPPWLALVRVESNESSRNRMTGLAALGACEATPVARAPSPELFNPRPSRKPLPPLLLRLRGSNRPQMPLPSLRVAPTSAHIFRSTSLCHSHVHCAFDTTTPSVCARRLCSPTVLADCARYWLHHLRSPDVGYQSILSFVTSCR